MLNYKTISCMIIVVLGYINLSNAVIEVDSAIGPKEEYYGYPKNNQTCHKKFFSHKSTCFLRSEFFVERELLNRGQFCLKPSKGKSCYDGLKSYTVDKKLTVCCTTEKFYENVPISHSNGIPKVDEIDLVSFGKCKIEKKAQYKFTKRSHESKNYPLCYRYAGRVSSISQKVSLGDFVESHFVDINSSSGHFCLKLKNPSDSCFISYGESAIYDLEGEAKVKFCCLGRTGEGHNHLVLNKNAPKSISISVPKGSECPYNDDPMYHSSGSDTKTVHYEGSEDFYLRDDNDLFLVMHDDKKFRIRTHSCKYISVDKIQFTYRIPDPADKTLGEEKMIGVNQKTDLGGICTYDAEKCVAMTIGDSCCFNNYTDVPLKLPIEMNDVEAFQLPRPMFQRCQPIENYVFYVIKGHCVYYYTTVQEEEEKYPTVDDRGNQSLCYLSKYQCAKNFVNEPGVHNDERIICCAKEKGPKIKADPKKMAIFKFIARNTRYADSYTLECPTFEKLKEKNIFEFSPVGISVDLANISTTVSSTITLVERTTSVRECIFEKPPRKYPKNNYIIPYIPGLECPEGFHIDESSDTGFSLKYGKIVKDVKYNCYQKNVPPNQTEPLFEGSYCVKPLSLACPQNTTYKKFSYCCKKSNSTYLTEHPDLDEFALYAQTRCTPVDGYNVVEKEESMEGMVRCFYSKFNPTGFHSAQPKTRREFWPLDHYSFLSLFDNPCPIEFSLEEFTIENVKSRMHLEGSSNYFFEEKENTIRWKTCSRSNLNYTTNTVNWPGGSYCVLKASELKCPNGFKLKGFGFLNLCCHLEDYLKELKLPGAVAEFTLFVPTEYSCPKSSYMKMHQSKFVFTKDKVVEKYYLCYYTHVDDVKTTSLSEWPAGKYLFPIPGSYEVSYEDEVHESYNSGSHPNDGNWPTLVKCPWGFNETVHVFDIEKRRHRLNFCERDPKIINKFKATEEKAVWPAGDYCFLQLNNLSCPGSQNLMLADVIQSKDAVPVSILTRYEHSGPWHEITKVNLEYSLCCATNGGYFTELPINNFGQFWLLPNPINNRCSRISNTYLKKQKMSDSWSAFTGQTAGPNELCTFMHFDGEFTSNSFHLSSYWDFDMCRCIVNASCDLKNDDLTCRCQEGFFGDGYKKCYQVKPNTDLCANACHPRAECKQDKDGKPYCECSAEMGYTGNGITCFKSCGNVPCNESQDCRYIDNNTHPICVCKAGFAKDGKRCNPSFSEAVYDTYVETLMSKVHCLQKSQYIDIMKKESDFFFLYLMDPTQSIHLDSCESFKRRLVVQLDKYKESNITRAKDNDNLVETVGGTRLNITMNSGYIYVNNLRTRINIYTNGLILVLDEPLRFDSSLLDGYPVAGVAVSTILVLLFLLALSVYGIMKLKKKYSFHRNLFSYNLPDGERLCSDK